MAKRSCNCDYDFLLQGHNRSYAPESVLNGVVRQNNVGFVKNVIPKGEKNLGSVPGTWLSISGLDIDKEALKI